MNDRHEQFDVAVIGAGPAGYTAALRCAASGLRTAVVDRDEIGGTCLNTGCVPTKAYVQAAHDLLRLKGLEDEGIATGPVAFSLRRLAERKDRIVDHLKRGIGFLFKKHGVTFLKGSAAFEDRNTLLLDGSKRISARRIVVATGSSPVVPGTLGDGLPGILTNENVFSVSEIPASLLVLGGGFIGCEFAFIFAALGSRVTVAEQLPEILPSFDADVTAEVKKHLGKTGAEILTGTGVASLAKTEGRVEAVLTDGRTLSFAAVLVAAGRKPNASIPGLAETGARTEKGFLAVDPATFETAAPGIFAIGDVCGPPLLAHKASDDAERFAEFVTAGRRESAARVIPQVLYTVPEAASVGATEGQLKAQGRDYHRTMVPFVPVARARIMNETAGFCKLLTSGDRLLGAHLVGPLASEIIPFLSLGLERSIPVSELGRHVVAHPTVAEIIKDALRAAGEKR
jgi:dihydrolipoamide dehydrogenase